jgi:hypothetical protein
MKLDGDNFLTSLPKQNNWLVEAGFYLKRSRLGPFVQYSQRDFDAIASADEKRTQVGLAWWGDGHKLSVKLAGVRLVKDREPARNQFVLQLQLFQY